MSSVPTANRSGQKFHNLQAKAVEGWVQEADYEVAKKIYESVSGT